MKIVIAPDSFKESLTALEVATAIEAGFKTIFPHAEYCKVPMADGGEGTVDAMVDATCGERIYTEVTAPLGNKVTACYGILGNNAEQKTAIIEMASASGLDLVPPEQRNPLITSSFGTGELINHAIEKGVRHFILGLGGSATNDAGAGMLKALGARFYDENNQDIGDGGAALIKLDKIDLSQLNPLLQECKIDVACDVDNPLSGIRGASHIFGPQKGATPQMVEELDRALAHFANIIFENNINHKDFRNHAGAGAAGGMGFAMLAVLNANLSPGVKLVTETVKLYDTMIDADLVITGEGRIDGQTVFGKTPMGVLNVANANHVPTIAIAGSLGDGANKILTKGMKAIFSVVPGITSLENALRDAEINVKNTAINVAATLKLGQRLN